MKSNQQIAYPVCKFTWLALLITFAFAATAEVPASQTKEHKLEIVALNSTQLAQRGHNEHSVTQIFWVDADVAELNFSCEITNMKIDGDSGGRAAPLVADVNSGCEIDIPGAIASIGGAQKRIATFKQENIRNGAALYSDYVTFRTREGEAFKQDVYVTIMWKDSAAMQISGTYKGAVKLIATIPNELEKAR